VALTGYLGNLTKPKSKISKLKELIQDKVKEIKLKKKALKKQNDN
jgi:hypothetical protein